MSQLVTKWNVFPPKLTMRFLLVCLFVCSVFIIVNLDGNNPLMLTSCATVCFNKFCSTWDFHPQFSQKSPQFSPLCPWASLYNDLDEILGFLHFVLEQIHSFRSSFHPQLLHLNLLMFCHWFTTFYCAVYSLDMESAAFPCKILSIHSQSVGSCSWQSYMCMNISQLLITHKGITAGS